MAGGARKALAKLRRKTPQRTEGIPGPSEDPATNYILADVAIRAASYLARRAAERRMLSGRYGKHTARAIVANKTVGQTLASFALARIATRSLPGAVIVGGGALAKSLYDRSKGKRQAKREGDRKLIDQATGE